MKENIRKKRKEWKTNIDQRKTKHQSEKINDWKINIEREGKQKDY